MTDKKTHKQRKASSEHVDSTEHDKRRLEQNEPTQEEIEAAIAAGEKLAARDIKRDAEKAAAQVSELAKELELSQAEAAEAKERLARVQADWDNFRKRTAQERKDERSRATEHLVLEIIPALDDMERAIEHTASFGNQEMISGIQAVYDKLQEALKKEGIEMVDPAGDVYDPTVAQAVSTLEDASVPNETVLNVLRKGYIMGGKVIREAMVVVSAGGPHAPANNAQNNASAPHTSEAEHTAQDGE